jgi:phosphinothricin acetyltransferase
MVKRMPDVAVQFVPLGPSHVADAQAIYNEYLQNTTVTFHQQPLEAEEFRKLVFFEDSRYAAYAIVDAETGHLAGYCVLAPYKSRDAYRLTAELTIYLRPGYVGRGLGTKAVHLLEEYARGQGFHALLASICGENRPSIKLFERLGYQRVAHRKEVGYKFGRFLDVVEYEKIISEKTSHGK